MKSLLERLRRRLRGLGQPLRDVAAATDGSRRPDHADVGEASQRRTELEATHHRQDADLVATLDQRSLPRQPPAPASTRVKAAVFAKRRRPAPQRHLGPVWGPSSFLELGGGKERDAHAAHSSLLLFEAPPPSSIGDSDPHNRSWPARQSPSAASAFPADPHSSPHRPWLLEHPPPALVASEPFNGFEAAAPRLEGGVLLGPGIDAAPPSSESQRHALDFGDAMPGSHHWRHDDSSA